MITTLIVEDESLIRRSLVKLVSDSSLEFSVIGEASNGSEGLELCKSLMPQVVITDIKMPQLNGLDLIKNARHLGIQCEFIILSGYGDFVFAQEAIRYGVIDYLLKPIKTEQLYMTLQKVKNKLYERQVDWGKYDQWLNYSSDEATRLSSFIWSMNENEALQLIKNFNQQWILDKETIAQQRNRSIEFLSRVNVQLQSYSKIQIPEVDKQKIHNLITSVTDLKTYNTNYISTLITVIRENRNFSAHQNIKRTIKYIENNYKDNELSQQAVAEYVNLSVPYLSLIFKQNVGISFSQYLIQYRMEIAKQLLTDPDRKAYDIPELIGYTDYAHFTKSFKKVYGVTPREYRKSLGFANS